MPAWLPWATAAFVALKALGTSSVAAAAVVSAMNLTVINFASGSSEIPGSHEGHAGRLDDRNRRPHRQYGRRGVERRAVAAPRRCRRPRASNDTEYGKFQNRRIEYQVMR